MRNDSTRPRSTGGLRVMSMLLALWGVAGLANAFIWNEAAMLLARQQFGLHVGGPAFKVMAMITGVTALAASVSIWWVNVVAKAAYVVWSAATLAFGIFVSIAGSGMPVITAMGLSAGLGVVLYGGLVFLRSQWAKVLGSGARRH
jgi:hypothetical protein